MLFFSALLILPKEGISPFSFRSAIISWYVELLEKTDAKNQTY